MRKNWYYAWHIFRYVVWETYKRNITKLVALLCRARKEVLPAECSLIHDVVTKGQEMHFSLLGPPESHFVNSIFSQLDIILELIRFKSRDELGCRPSFLLFLVSQKMLKLLHFLSN